VFIEFRVNGRSARGYGAVPPSGRGPGVLVIHAWWGLVDHIKAVVDRLAAEGFVALAPDLYYGDTARAPERAGQLMMDLSIDETERDLRGAIECLFDNPVMSSPKVGVIGFSMGGALSLQTAAKSRAIGACVVFYGLRPGLQPDLSKVEAPVLGFYGERDRTISPERVREMERTMKSLGKQVEVVFYPARHAFFDDTRPGGYNRDAAADSWRRTLEFLRRNLG
jgi:carboxymethylenebutenolidase